MPLHVELQLKFKILFMTSSLQHRACSLKNLKTFCEVAKDQHLALVNLTVCHIRFPWFSPGVLSVSKYINGDAFTCHSQSYQSLRRHRDVFIWTISTNGFVFSTVAYGKRVMMGFLMSWNTPDSFKWQKPYTRLPEHSYLDRNTRHASTKVILKNGSKHWMHQKCIKTYTLTINGFFSKQCH